VLRIAERHEHVLLNTHATFRWRHGLFAAFDFDQIKEFNAELYVTMLDNAESCISGFCAIMTSNIRLRTSWSGGKRSAGDGNPGEYYARLWEFFHGFARAECADGADDLSPDVERKRKKVYLSSP